MTLPSDLFLIIRYFECFLFILSLTEGRRNAMKYNGLAKVRSSSWCVVTIRKSAVNAAISSGCTWHMHKGHREQRLLLARPIVDVDKDSSNEHDGDEDTHFLMPLLPLRGPPAKTQFSSIYAFLITTMTPLPFIATRNRLSASREI
jgi:hypothetical protein